MDSQKSRGHRWVVTEEPIDPRTQSGDAAKLGGAIRAKVLYGEDLYREDLKGTKNGDDRPASPS